MNRATEIELMRLLHGELPAEPARRLRDRMEREPELAAAWARLERTWNGLELPPPAPVPPGFSRRILAAAIRTQAGQALTWSAAPTWVRAAAAAALAAGLALGAGAGSWVGKLSRSADDTSVAAADAMDSSLAESYWDSLSDTESGGATTDGAEL
jgi:anti-sigma factor RsiW